MLSLGIDGSVDTVGAAAALQAPDLGAAVLKWTVTSVVDPVFSGVTTQASARCVSGKVVVVVTVKNTAAVTMDAVLTSDFGTKTVSLAAGRTVSHAFSTRKASVAAGAVTVDLSAQSGGTTRRTKMQAAYALTTCS
ncbi:hypothetical protein C5C10_17410 [Rathayibacter sp. AY1A3]|nr:hypothetical protein C5C10_17410 [Rathayibacter sp. AY1A3]